MVTPTLQAAAWVHPRRLILSDRQQVIARLRRPEGPWRGNRAGFNLKGWQPQSPMEATHHRRGCLSLLAPERPLQNMESDFFSNAESGVVEMAMQGQYTTTALQQPNRGVQKNNTLGPRSQGRNGQGRTREVPRHVRTFCTRVTGGTEETQSDLQKEEERSHRQAAEGGERGNSRQNMGNKAYSPTAGTASRIRTETIKNSAGSGGTRSTARKAPHSSYRDVCGLGGNENSQVARR